MIPEKQECFVIQNTSILREQDNYPKIDGVIQLACRKNSVSSTAVIFQIPMHQSPLDSIPKILTQQIPGRAQKSAALAFQISWKPQMGKRPSGRSHYSAFKTCTHTVNTHKARTHTHQRNQQIRLGTSTMFTQQNKLLCSQHTPEIIKE